MADFKILREERKEGGGYVHLKAVLDDDGDSAQEIHTVLAQASYWPKHRSAYLWTAKAMEDQRCGRAAALSKEARYNVEEAEVLAWVEEEARGA